MADKDEMAARAKTARLVEHDKVQVEFLVDDLIKQLVKDHVIVASCNGCNHCGGAALDDGPVVNPAAKKGG